MARGVPSPAPGSLPKPSFTKVEGYSAKDRGVNSGQQWSYGYNDFSDFVRPDYYIRHVEPLESDLAWQVEYDMDEQDQEWLDALNEERHSNHMDKIAYETFEIVMDRLEKEWFDLTKNIAKPDMAMPSEDTTCAICDDSEGENTNAIVFCDGCNLAVHQDCYGVPYIPEGQWLCRKCTVSPENPVSCLLCPNEGGAFKQNTAGEWVHLLCAIWVPETRVANEVFMEPITGTDKIPKQRWKLKCSVCDIRDGACIQCSKNSCFLAFHVTCARKEKLLMPMKASSGLEPPPLQCFCEKHLPRERIRPRLDALAAEAAAEESLPTGDPKSSKSARAYAKTYKPGPPIIPALAVRRIGDWIAKIGVRKRAEFIELVARYWSLKREARRGAPLLKRLHLEPWTASAGGRVQEDEEKAAKLEHMRRLKQELGQIRDIAELVRKRESRKYRQLELIQTALSKIVFPKLDPVRVAFDKITAVDKASAFREPVSKAQVPDYYDIVKRPMCWSVIEDKLDAREYWDLQSFKDDINLVVDNAILYNPPTSSFFRLANRVKGASLQVFAELEKTLGLAQAQVAPTVPASEAGPSSSAPVSARAPAPNTDGEPSSSPPPAPTPPAKHPIGDLEPSLPLLSLLTSSEIGAESELQLSSNPLTYLFNYEFPIFKPPPPPPPPPPPRTKRGGGPRAERLRQRWKKQEELDASSGFRALRSHSAAGEGEGEGGDEGEGEAGPSTAEGSKRRKRSVGALSSTGVVKDVDPHASFKMFESGWILPSGQKRGGRAAVERAPGMPPRKRQRLGSKRQEDGAYASVGPSSSALGEDRDVAMEDRAATFPIEEPMDVDTSAATQENDRDVGAGDKTELERSALSKEREEAMDRVFAKEEEKRAASLGAESDLTDLSSLSSSDEEDEEEGHGDEKDGEEGGEREGGGEEESGEEGNEEQEDEAQAVQEELEPKPQEKKDMGGGLNLAEGESLEAGTLVWARIAGHPWWPAAVHDKSEAGIPDQVLREEANKEKVIRTSRKKGKYAPRLPLHLVKFYNDDNRWGWMDCSNLKMMCEDEELDKQLLKYTRRIKKALTEKIAVAYKEALAERDGEGDDEDDGEKS